jgi:hypothetical protein
LIRKLLPLLALLLLGLCAPAHAQFCMPSFTSVTYGAVYDTIGTAIYYNGTPNQAYNISSELDMRATIYHLGQDGRIDNQVTITIFIGTCLMSWTCPFTSGTVYYPAVGLMTINPLSLLDSNSPWSDWAYATYTYAYPADLHGPNGFHQQATGLYYTMHTIIHH